MLKFFKRLFSSPAAPAPEPQADAATERLDREIDALYSILADEAGSDRLVIKAGKMDAMRLMGSPVRGERVLALERTVYENPTIERVPTESEIPAILVELSERIADIMARRSMEVNSLSGRTPASFSSSPPCTASALPLSDRATSTQPVKRFFAFHSLSPWRSSTSL